MNEGNPKAALVNRLYVLAQDRAALFDVRQVFHRDDADMAPVDGYLSNGWISAYHKELSAVSAGFALWHLRNRPSRDADSRQGSLGASLRNAKSSHEVSQTSVDAVTRLLVTADVSNIIPVMNRVIDLLAKAQVRVNWERLVGEMVDRDWNTVVRAWATDYHMTKGNTRGQVR